MKKRTAGMRAHGVVSLFPFFCVRTRPVRAPLLSHVTAKGSLHNLLLAHCNSPHCCRVEPKWRGHAHPRKRRAREPFTCFTSSALILIPGGPGGGEGPAIAGSRWWRARPWCGGRAACVTSKRGYEKKGKSERKGRREERKKKKRRSLSIILFSFASRAHAHPPPPCHPNAHPTLPLLQLHPNPVRRRRLGPS